MKKTLATAATLLILVSALTFANGTKEDSTRGTWGPGNGPMAQNETTGTLLTLQGTLKLVAGDHPQIVTKDGTYELMYPYMYADGIKLKDGEQITVKGYDAPAYRWNNSSEDEKHLMVTEATIGGKEYKLDRDNFGPMGRRGGRMGGRSPRGGSNSGRGGRW